MFRFANAARIHMNTTRRHIAHMHDPITAGLKPKYRIPKGTGVNDMVTKLWDVNPGLVVTVSAVGTFAFGCGVHVITRATPINSSMEHVLEKA